MFSVKSCKITIYYLCKKYKCIIINMNFFQKKKKNMNQLLENMKMRWQKKKKLNGCEEIEEIKGEETSAMGVSVMGN